MTWMKTMLLVFLLVQAGAAGAAVYFVDDDCSGFQNGAESNPFCRINDAVREMVAGDSCRIHAGTYREKLVLRAGLGHNRLGFNAYGDGEVVISGLEAVTAWVEVDKVRHIWRADVSSLANFDSQFQVPQVFMRGLPLDLARYPDNPGGKLLQPMLGRVTEGVFLPSGQQSWIKSGELVGGNWTGGLLWLLSGAKMVAFVQRIESHDPVNGILRYFATAPYDPATADYLYKPDADSRFFIFNTLAALSAGEFYYDHGARQLYLVSPAYPVGVEARTRKFGVELHDCVEVSFSGLTFMAASFSFGVPGANAGTGCVLRDSRVLYPMPFYAFVNTGDAWNGWSGWPGRSVLLSGKKNRIEHTEVAYSWGDGVSVFDETNFVERCDIHDVDWMASNASAVFLKGAGHQVLYSEISEAGRSGIVHGDAKGSTITRNDIHHFGRLTTDLGGTYGHSYSGSAEGLNNVITYNWVHDVAPEQAKGDGRSIYCGIYQDHYMRNTLIHHNVVYNMEQRVGGVARNRGIGIQTNRPRVAGEWSLGHKIYHNTLWNYSTGMNDYGPGNISDQRVINNVGHIPLKSATFPVTTYTANHEIARLDAVRYFEDAARSNFLPVPGSPAIDAGIAITAPVGVNEGMAGPKPDVSAYEYRAGPEFCCWRPGPDQADRSPALPWIILLMGN